MFSSINNTIKSNIFSTLCNICQQGKSRKFLMSHVHVQYANPFDIVHMDLWVSYPVILMNIMKYFLLFVDGCKDTCGFIYYLIKQKMHKFYFTLNLWLKGNLTLKWINYIVNTWKSFVLEWLSHIFSFPYTPSQNGVVKNKNRNVFETSLTLLMRSSVGIKY